jgi:glutaredoxin
VIAKNYLDNNNFEYKMVDIDSSPSAREFVISEGHRTMPQIYHDGQLLVPGGAQALSRMDPNMVRSLISAKDLGLGDFKL